MKATATKMITAAIAAVGLVGFAAAGGPESPDVPVNCCPCPATIQTKNLTCVLISCGDPCVYECHSVPTPRPY